MAIVNTNTAPILKEGTNITLSQVGQTITITSSAGSAAGGSNTEVQYNSGGALEGDPSFTYNDTTNVVSLESVDFATTPVAADAERRLKWDNDEGSLVLTLKGGNVTIPLGAEIVSLVYNAEATTLAKGEVVYAFGASGQRVSVKRAVNTADATSAQTFGIIAESIAAGAEGFCMVQGMVRGIDTSAYTQGDPIYLGATAGTFVKTKPVAPNHLVYLGFVVKVNASSGEIFVRPQNGYEMDEIHDYLEGSVQNNDVISYETSSGLYKPKSIPTLLGYTPMQNPMSVVGDIIYGGASGTPTRLAGRILTSRGFLSSVGDGTNSTAPTWRRISLASDVDDTLDYTQGGTGLSSLGTAYDYLRVNSAGTALEYASLGSLSSTGLEILDTYGIKWVTTLGGAGNALISFTDTSGMAFYSNGLVTPTLFLQDATSRQVGIGTITPSAKLDVNGDVNISTINNATTDTDKFLVSDGGIIKYRTGSEILSDIGANNYLPLAGGTMTGQIVLKEGTDSSDYSKGLRFPNDPYGGGSDTSGLRLYRDGAGTEKQVLELYVTNDVTGSTQDRINFSAADNSLVTINNNIIWHAGNLSNPVTGTGTSGYVAYFNGTGSITSDNFYWDATNDRLGLKTNAPTETLDVDGTAKIRTINQASTTPPKFLVSTAAGLIQYRSGPEILSDIGGAAAADFVTLTTAQTISGQKTFSSVIQGDVGLDVLDGQGITWRAASYGAANARINFTNTSGMAFYSDGTVTPTMFLSDDGNRRVGIGTTTPNAKLSFGNTVADNKIYLYDGTSDKYGFGIRSNQFLIYSGAAGASSGGILLGKFDGTTFTQNAIFTNDGNFGLGVTPSAWNTVTPVLQIGTASFYGYGTEARMSANYLYQSADKYIGNGFATTYVQQSGQHIWSTASNNTSGAGAALTFTQAMTLNASGNLSIGNTNDTYKLDVTGTGRFTNGINVNSTGGEMVNINVIDNSARQGIRLNNGINASSGIVLFNSSSSTGTETDGLLRVHQQSTSLSQPSAVFRQDGNADILQLQGSSGSIKMRITSGGNVGIGTTSPFTLLHVNGTPDNNYGNLTVFDNRSAATNYGGVVSFSGYKTTNTAANVWGQIKGANELGTGVENGYLAFITNTGTAYAERMRITSGGEIIQSVTNGIFTQQGGSGYSLIRLYGNSNAVELQLGANQSSGLGTIGTYSSSDLMFKTANTERVRITSGGAFGFNTDVTTGVTGNTLYIRSSSSNVGQTALVIQDYNKTNRWAINGQNGAGNYDFAIFSAPTGANDWSQKVTIQPGGNVGINDTNPSYRLSLTGDQKITSGSLGVNVNPNATDGRIDASNDIVAYSSDKRLKRNIKEIEDALYKIQRLQGFTYNWNDLAKEKAGFDTDINMVGLFAQDVQEVLPEAVKLAPFDNNGNDESISGENYLTVQYDKLVPLLIEAIKDLNNKYNQLKNGI